MKANNVIEINGKLYDAKSGKLLTSQTKKPVASPAKQKNHGRSIDGMASTHKKPVLDHNEQSSRDTKPASTTRTTHKAPLSVRRSTTLNRSSVKQPHIHTPSLPTEPEISPASTVVATTPESTALKHADSRRVKRASTITKSPAISKFNFSTTSNSTTDEQPAPLTDHLARSHEQNKKQLLASKAAANVLKSQTTADHIHTHKKRGKHITRYATGVLAALVLVGYVAYLNVPGISMKVAAYQAGFSATMPAYKPAGYSLSGPIAASPGQVSLSFASNTDDRNFSLSQQPTTWDSTALLENVIVKKSQNYLTYQDRGLTIYIYDGSSAAWVNNGKLYQVEGKNSNLDTDQLLKLATSV